MSYSVTVESDILVSDVFSFSRISVFDVSVNAVFSDCRISLVLQLVSCSVTAECSVKFSDCRIYCQVQ